MIADPGSSSNGVGAFVGERVGVDSPPAPRRRQRDDPHIDASHGLGARRNQPRDARPDEPIMRALSMDKAMRCARQINGWAVHLLSAMLHDVPAVPCPPEAARETTAWLLPKCYLSLIFVKIVRNHALPRCPGAK